MNLNNTVHLTVQMFRFKNRTNKTTVKNKTRKNKGRDGGVMCECVFCLFLFVSLFFFCECCKIEVVSPTPSVCYRSLIYFSTLFIMSVVKLDVQPRLY